MESFHYYWIFVMIYLKQTGCSEYCVYDDFKAICKPNEVVVMETAIMGRMQLNKCVKTDFGYIGCQDDVIGFMDQKCSGRRNCTVEVSDADLAKSNPSCNQEFKSYLDATYRCQPVITRSCGGSVNRLLLTEQSGYISNILTEETGCGGDSAPWVIQTTPGKVINLTLLDFGWKAENRVSFSSTCYDLASVHEVKATRRRQYVCGEHGRKVAHAYRSVTNQVQVRVSRRHLPKDRSYFLLHYQVIGCPDPPLSEGTHFRREGNTAYVSCDDEKGERAKWTIECSPKTDRWVGEYHNCTNGPNVLKYPKSGKRIDSGSRDSWWLPFPWDISIALISGVAFVIGCCIFVVGLFVLKRRSADDIRRRQQHILLREAHDQTFGKYPAYPDPTDPHFKVDPPVSETQGGSANTPIENEYAYVSDFPPPPSPKTLRMCVKEQTRQQQQQKPKKQKNKVHPPEGGQKGRKPGGPTRQPVVPQEQFMELDIFNSDRRKSS